MTSISKTQDMLAMIRAQALRRMDDATKSRPSAPSNESAAPRVTVGQRVTERLARLSRDDPHRKRRAVHCFLEGVLFDLIGQEAVGESMTQQIIDQVERTMTQDQALGAAIDQLAERLLAGIDSGRTLSELSDLFAHR